MNLTSDYLHTPVKGYHLECGRGKKKKTIVDACRFLAKDGSDEIFEVMALRGDGEELACVRTSDWLEMKRAYSRMVQDYMPAEWVQLMNTLATAKAVAEAVTGDDGGTCNNDSPAIDVPEGMTFKQLEGICNAAGVGCFAWRPFGKGPASAVIGAHGIGQGNRRTKGAEAACEYLKAHGIKCGMYYQMD